MKRIVQLDASLINKIAAGEVVERPLSVIKELVENSIDAGATSITVEISGGGLSSMRITDNGSGINKDSLPLAFSRHATSKITCFDDLMRVQTMGFRGEALSSISAVAQVELITKTTSDSMGSRIVVHGGKIIQNEEISATDGTTIIVSNLFYNVPARRKFLKKPATEAGHISHAVERLALGNPNLAIRYINEGNIVFITSGANDLKTAILKIYGREAATKLVEIKGEEGELVLSGYIAKPEIARGNRQHESFFVNGRYVSSRLLIQAVETGVKTMFGVGKFPLFVLNLSLPFASVDVNVHPNKMDVRFADEEAVFSFIQKTVVSCFREENLIPEVKPWKRNDVVSLRQGALPYEKNLHIGARLGSAMHDSNTTDRTSPAPPENINGRRISQTTRYSFDAVKPLYVASPKSRAYGGHFFTHPVIIGQIFASFWLVSQDDSLYLIDQHAAHERILYERIFNELSMGNIPKQNLLEPIKLCLTPQEKRVLEDNIDIFGDFGFEVLGDEVLAVPLLIKGTVDMSFFTELLDRMGEAGFSKDSVYSHKAEAISMAACKAAVKAGAVLHESEAREIIEKLLYLDNPFTCPHGRPTIIEISKREIEKRFGRV